MQQEFLALLSKSVYFADQVAKILSVSNFLRILETKSIMYYVLCISLMMSMIKKSLKTIVMKTKVQTLGSGHAIELHEVKTLKLELMAM